MESEQDGEQVVAEFVKNSTEKLRVSLTEYRGHSLCNVRIYYEDGDEYKPSRKGVAFNVALLPELEKAIRKARAAAQVDGDRSEDPEDV